MVLTRHVRADTPVGLRLENGVSFAILVNVPGAEVPAFLRVEPGNPDKSQLIQKLEGTAAVTGNQQCHPTVTSTARSATLEMLAPWPENDARAEETPPRIHRIARLLLNDPCPVVAPAPIR